MKKTRREFKEADRVAKAMSPRITKAKKRVQSAKAAARSSPKSKAMKQRVKSAEKNLRTVERKAKSAERNAKAAKKRFDKAREVDTRVETECDHTGAGCGAIGSHKTSLRLIKDGKYKRLNADKNSPTAKDIVPDYRHTKKRPSYALKKNRDHGKYWYNAESTSKVKGNTSAFQILREMFPGKIHQIPSNKYGPTTKYSKADWKKYHDIYEKLKENEAEYHRKLKAGKLTQADRDKSKALYEKLKRSYSPVQ